MTNDPAARPDRWTDPIEPDTRAIFHRAYHIDLDEGGGGGFGQGEFLLRSDGVLFTRAVSRALEHRPDGPTSAWRRDTSWTGGPDVAGLLAWLERRGFDVGGSVFLIADRPGAEARR